MDTRLIIKIELLQDKQYKCIANKPCQRNAHAYKPMYLPSPSVTGGANTRLFLKCGRDGLNTEFSF